MKKKLLAMVGTAAAAAGMWLVATPTANACPPGMGHLQCCAFDTTAYGHDTAWFDQCSGTPAAGNFPQCQQYPTAVQRGVCNDRVLAGFPPGDTPVQ
jgi:hypothetical protein